MRLVGTQLTSDPPCVQRGPDADISRLPQLHRRAFHDWLALSLPEQRDDLLIYLDGRPTRRVIVPELMKFGAAALPPERAHLETQLFTSDLAAIQSSMMPEIS